MTKTGCLLLIGRAFRRRRLGTTSSTWRREGGKQCYDDKQYNKTTHKTINMTNHCPFRVASSPSMGVLGLAWIEACTVPQRGIRKGGSDPKAHTCESLLRHLQVTQFPDPPRIPVRGTVILQQFNQVGGGAVWPTTRAN